MKKEGLYLPKYFKYQKYNNLFDVPIKKTEDENYFVPLEYFRNMYLGKNKKIFDNITRELVLRGGEFFLEKGSPLFPKVSFNNIEEIIVIDNVLTEDAYKKIDYKLLDIQSFKNYYQIDSNDFFHYIPLKGFQVLNMSEDRLQLFKRQLLKNNFQVKKINISTNKIIEEQGKKINSKKIRKHHQNNTDKIEKIENIIENSNNIFYKNILITEIGFKLNLSNFFSKKNIKTVFDLSKLNTEDLNNYLNVKNVNELFRYVDGIPLKYDLIAFKVKKVIEDNGLDDIIISELLKDSYYVRFNNIFEKTDLDTLGDLNKNNLIKVFKAKWIGKGKILRFLSEIANIAENKDEVLDKIQSKKLKFLKKEFAFVILKDLEIRKYIKENKISFVSKNELNIIANKIYPNKKERKMTVNNSKKEMEKIDNYEIPKQFGKNLGSLSIKLIMSILNLEYVYEDLIALDFIERKDLDGPLNGLLLKYDNIPVQLKQIIYMISDSLSKVDKLLEGQLELYREKLNFDDREEVIFTKRILRNKQYTLEELGQKFGVSRERIRQIESKLKKKIISLLTVNNIKLYLYYLESNKIFILDSKKNICLISRLNIPGIHYDKNLKIVVLNVYKEKINHIFSEISNVLEDNTIIQLDRFKNFINILDSGKSSNIIDLINSRIPDILAKHNSINHNNYVVKKTITKNDLYDYIIINFYDDKILDLDTKEGFTEFIDYLLLLGQKNIANELQTSNRVASLRRIESILGYNNSSVLKLSAHKYRALDIQKVPYELIDNIDIYIEKEIIEYDFVSAKKIYKSFKNKLDDIQYNEDTIYYLLEMFLDDKYKFSGHSSTFRIYDKDSKKKSTPEIILKTLEDNNRKMHIDDLTEQIGVERYTIEQQAEELNILISNKIVILLETEYRLSNKSESYVLRLYNKIMDDKEYVPIKKIYDEIRFDGDINEELISLNCNNLEDFRHLLKGIVPDSDGHTKILFRKDKILDYFDIFVNELGGEGEYFRLDLEEVGESIGLANSTIHLYIKEFINKGQLIPIYIDQYLHKNLFTIDGEVLQKVEEFLDEEIGHQQYLSLSTISSKLRKLPKVDYSWNIELLNYIAIHKLSYEKVNISRLDYNKDPLLIKTCNSNLSYSDIVRKELTEFDDIKIEGKILKFLKQRGLVDSDAKTLYQMFFTKGLLTKNEFNRIEIAGENLND